MVEALLSALWGLLDADAGALPASVREVLAHCEDLRRSWDAAYDLTNGRPHDCPRCLDEYRVMLGTAPPVEGPARSCLD